MTPTNSLPITFDDTRSISKVIDAHSGESNLARSVLRALLVLSVFPSDGSYRTLGAVSKQLGYNPSTTHRYLRTWLAIGLLEQDPKSRRYRRPWYQRSRGPSAGAPAPRPTTKRAAPSKAPSATSRRRSS